MVCDYNGCKVLDFIFLLLRFECPFLKRYFFDLWFRIEKDVHF
ncbi:hypothetical protein ADICYQ_0123 [Cyclobacterium qasimii M12-11B]|uniref:Uncharacterized protein n=1 Tax=Cyclobacterium qasimii M12-11B TaxID=641524 RepID=S7VQN4_9BACT|nr:hypothetical protein ADICYQ_0123 [Cyclobacterium qasimii M12-11B]